MSQDNYIIVICPHCTDYIYINTVEFNCKIFRHRVYKQTHRQIDPHLNKVECDRLYNENQIYGCGKPFILVEQDSRYSTIICDYI
jgi:hypothetical protein